MRIEAAQYQITYQPVQPVRPVARYLEGAAPPTVPRSTAEDRVSLSLAAEAWADQEQTSAGPATLDRQSNPLTTETAYRPGQSTAKDSTAVTSQLQAAEVQELEILSRRDQEVRAHEQAHAAAAGAYAIGGPQYSFTRGPNGRLFATSGAVEIDISAVAGDPAATIEKAQQVQRAALAPAEPSGKDRQVAARAAAIAQEARADIAEQSRAENSPGRVKKALQRYAETQDQSIDGQRRPADSSPPTGE